MFFLELATLWVLSDNSHGNAINITGKIIKKCYNARPEILLYQSLHGNIRNTRNINGINHLITSVVITGNTNTEEPRISIDEEENKEITQIEVNGESNILKPGTDNHRTIHGNANYGEPRMIRQAIQVHGETNSEDPRTSILNIQDEGNCKESILGNKRI